MEVNVSSGLVKQKKKKKNQTKQRTLTKID